MYNKVNNFFYILEKRNQETNGAGLHAQLPLGIHHFSEL